MNGWCVHVLLVAGLPHSQIAGRLWLDGKTVRRFARATTSDEPINGAPTRRRGTSDRHAVYLTARWNAGVTSTRQLHQELCDGCPDLGSSPANGSLPSPTYSSIAAAAQRWKHGSSGPRHAPCLRYAATPPACVPAGTRSPPVSPTRGAPARPEGRGSCWIKMIKRQMFGRANPDLLRTCELADQ
ncbi:conserved hypothetical protein [Frankia sp. Hr75.2]|nr:conserved hypothetical protein [Frankia sp. Hr75.2]